MAGPRCAGGADISPEFTVSAAHVLRERVNAHDHAGGAMQLEATHRTEPLVSRR